MADDPALADLRALVVDDEDIAARMIEAVLRRLGIGDVTRVADGLKALEQVETTARPFTLVICDWMMPNLDGLEFLKRFRRIDRKTPFVMLTAKTDTKDFHIAKSLGANYFLMKPLNPEDLRIRLDGVIRATLK